MKWIIQIREIRGKAWHLIYLTQGIYYHDTLIDKPDDVYSINSHATFVYCSKEIQINNVNC